MSECLDDNLALELIDGKLPSPRRTAVERHIATCDACRELVVALAKDDAKSASLGEPPIDTHRAPESPPVLSQAGPYRIEREVGSGAAGTVFRAVDERDGQVVALKYVTDPGWRARFAREIETLSRLVHPGIVRYVSHGETRQGLYLAMEWLDGEDLARAMDRGPIPWPAVRLLGLRLTAALAHAHAMGAVHRDIGPRNIFLPGGRLEQAKLLDFGLVRVHDTLDRTASQAVLGTPHYMAPEQVKDPRTVDARSDIFSLGVVFYEALAGRRPFDGDDLFTIWQKIVEQPAPDLRAIAPTVPEGFVALVERMLAKDPAQRPTAAAVVHEALVRLDAPNGSAGGVSTAVTPPLQQLPTQRSAGPPPPVYTSPPAAPFYSAPPAPAFTAPPPTYTPRSGPYVLPSSRDVAPPTTKSNNSGIIIVAAVLVAGAIVIAGLVVVLGPRFLKETSLAAGGAQPAATAPAPAAAADDDDDEPPAKKPSAKPAPSPSPAPAKPAARVAEQFFCGSDAIEHRRGGLYAAKDAEDAVVIGAECQAVLEDCVINGPNAINILNKGQLTLRRCRVTGKTQLIGDAPVLILEGTALPSPAKIVGRGRVVQR
ncbi:MAG: protein kinase [Labilithrix sp.]|nr:protein kinase [Labilithrix sp.]MCW5811002.1 protein kinase [Labilithrix sp.]